MACYWFCDECRKSVDYADSDIICTNCGFERDHYQSLAKNHIHVSSHSSKVVGRTSDGQEIKLVQMPLGDLKAGKFD